MCVICFSKCSELYLVTMNADEMVQLAERLSTSYDGCIYTGESDDFGAWRSVKIFDDFVVKTVSHSEHKDCLFEWCFYTMVDDEVKNYLCKPLYISRNGRSVVMERLNILNDRDEYEKNENRIRELANLLSSRYGIKYLCDIRSGNVGYRKDGALVCSDYANLVHGLDDKIYRLSVKTPEMVTLGSRLCTHKGFDQSDIAIALSLI